MKNKTVKMVIAVAVLVVCCGAYAGVKTYVAKQEQKESEEETEEKTTVFSASADDIQSLDFMIDKNETTFEKDNDQWIKKDEKEFPVNQTTLDDAASSVTFIESDRVLSDVEDLEEYGLDTPSNTLKIVTKDSGDDSSEDSADDSAKTVTTTLYVGDENSSTSQYYVYKDDDKTTVYMVDASSIEPFTKDLYDYAQGEDFPAISNTDDINKIYVSGENSYELVKNDDNSLWTIQGAGDEKEKTDSATVSSLVSSFGSMAYNSFVNYKCDDKSEYGLDDPYAVITVDYQEEVENDSEDSDDTDNTEDTSSSTEENSTDTSESDDTDTADGDTTETTDSDTSDADSTDDTEDEKTYVGDENTAITAMIRHYDRLLCFKLDSAWAIGYSQVTLADGWVTAGFYVAPINRSVGNCAPGQAVLVENRPRTLDGRSVVEWKSTSSSGNINGDERNAERVSQRVDETIRTFDLETAKTFYDKYAHEYYVIGADGTALVHGIDADAWYVYTNCAAKCLINYMDELYFGTADGYLRHFSTQYFSDEGEAIDAYWESGSMPFAADFRRKYSAMLWVGIRPDDNGYLEVSAKTDRKTDFAVYSFSTADAAQVPEMNRIKLKAKKFTYYNLILANNTSDRTATVVSVDIRVRGTGYVR